MENMLPTDSNISTIKQLLSNPLSYESITEALHLIAERIDLLTRRIRLLNPPANELARGVSLLNLAEDLETHPDRAQVKGVERETCTHVQNQVRSWCEDQTQVEACRREIKILQTIRSQYSNNSLS